MEPLTESPLTESTFLEANPEPQETYTITAQKFGYSLLSGVLFLILANPTSYQLFSSILNKLSGSLCLGRYIANEQGCATLFGLLLNAGIFVFCIFLIMIFSEKKHISLYGQDNKTTDQKIDNDPTINS